MLEEKQKALDLVLKEIEKQYGKGAIMKLGQGAADQTIDVIPTGCLTLDLALGIGGVPRGRIIEIYGPESSGKTTVALHVIVSFSAIVPPHLFQLLMVAFEELLVVDEVIQTSYVVIVYMGYHPEVYTFSIVEDLLQFPLQPVGIAIFC